MALNATKRVFIFWGTAYAAGTRQSWSDGPAIGPALCWPKLESPGLFVGPGGRGCEWDEATNK
eukprot:9141033-Lingulodinium_polyedra.AAC.1